MQTCLINLVSLNPQLNGGVSRIAYEVCQMLVEKARLNDHLQLVFVVNDQFAPNFAQWLGQESEKSPYIILPYSVDETPDYLFGLIQPDLIISPLYGTAPFYETELFPGVPHITQMPDTLPLDKPALFPPDNLLERQKLYKQLEKASMVVTISQFSREQLLKHLDLGPDRVTVIPLGADSLPDTDSYNKQLPVSSSYILYPAKTWLHKRHDLLFRVMKEIWKTRPDVTLVLTGGHAQEGQTIAELMQQYAIPAEQVINLSYVSDTELKALYYHAEALLFMSEYEGFGLPVLEAMQIGCPVICAPVSSLPEIAGDAALYVNSDEPSAWAQAFLETLPLQRAALIANGRARAAQFKWSEHRQRWETLLRQYGLQLDPTTDLVRRRTMRPFALLSAYEGSIHYFDGQHLLQETERPGSPSFNQPAHPDTSSLVSDKTKNANADNFSNSAQTTPVVCWCGNSKDFVPFSPEYVRCLRCNTLISTQKLSNEELRVQNDSEDFYGKEYWLSHQTEELGYPPIEERARQDLAERCLFWLKTLLKYRTPPARTLELGASHGAFVGLLQLAGFDATGLELSPWVVDYAAATFNIPMLLGTIEEQAIAPGSLDVIVLMDVLEHLPDPVGTMSACLRLLKPNGILLIQTPEYRDQEYAEMQAANDPFLVHTSKYNEHLYLFSKRGVRMLFDRLGAAEIVFEPAIFKQYDMFFVVSREALVPLLSTESEKALKQTLTGRAVLAMLDLYQFQKSQVETIDMFRRAAEERLELVNKQDGYIKVLQQAADERLALINEQAGYMRRVENLAEERANVINEQAIYIGRLQQVIDEQVALIKLSTETAASANQDISGSKTDLDT